MCSFLAAAAAIPIYIKALFHLHFLNGFAFSVFLPSHGQLKVHL